MFYFFLWAGCCNKMFDVSVIAPRNICNFDSAAWEIYLRDLVIIFDSYISQLNLFLDGDDKDRKQDKLTMNSLWKCKT